MAEYIDREALLDRMNNFCEINCDYTKKQRSVMCGSCGIGDAKIMVEDAVAEYVRPVVRGEWQEKAVWDDVVFVCSNCEEPWTLIEGTPEQNNMNFCPNCGADMRGIEDGETN